MPPSHGRSIYTLSILALSRIVQEDNCSDIFLVLFVHHALLYQAVSCRPVLFARFRREENAPLLPAFRLKLHKQALNK